MKKLILLLLAFLLILPSITLVNAETETMEFVIDGEKYVIKQEDFPVPFEITANGKVYKLNKEIVQNQGYAVYGDYNSVPGNEKKEGQWRYLGYNLEGSPFANFDFPWEGRVEGRTDAERKWIKEPWKVIGNSGKTLEQRRTKYWIDPRAKGWLDSLNIGGGWTGEKLIDYFNIHSPQDDFIAGLIVGWHLDAGIYWYKVFHLPPLEPIIIEELIPKSASQDYSTLIIRTGTENLPDSKPKANTQNEAVVEYRVTNSNDKTGIAEIELEIKNSKNLSVEGLLEARVNGEKITGKLDMSEAYAFGELLKHPEFITFPEVDLDRQRWQNKKGIEVQEYTAGYRSYKNAKGNFGNIAQNEKGEDHIARAITSSDRYGNVYVLTVEARQRIIVPTPPPRPGSFPTRPSRPSSVLTAYTISRVC